MEKINFVNNSEPYLSAENLNQMQDNMENATQRNITTDGEPVKCGYQIDGKDVYVARRSFATSSSETNNSTSIDISDLGYSEISEISGISNRGVLLGDRQAVTYDTRSLSIWFNNDTALSFEGKVMIYFTK